MLTFTDCKINIGLNILRKRPDGYHDISTVMVHVPWCDIVEIIPKSEGETTLRVLGNPVNCPPEKNLVMKAYRALAAEYGLGPVEIVLQKIVPDGAGLGGGSADATYTLIALNKLFGLDLDADRISSIAARLGADCAFFAYDRPMLAEGIGEILTPVDVDLKGYTIAIVKPCTVNISTPQAYAGVTPRLPEQPLTELIKLPVEQWQGRIINDFEQSIFKLAPEVGMLKQRLLESGALYASMSGSGASVYGIFANDKMAEEALKPYQDYPHIVFKG